MKAVTGLQKHTVNIDSNVTGISLVKTVTPRISHRARIRVTKRLGNAGISSDLEAEEQTPDDSR